MNDGYPPLSLKKPEKRARKKTTGKPMSLGLDAIDSRGIKAKELLAKVDALSAALSKMSDEERRAVFYRLESEGAISKTTITGTDLIVVAQPAQDTLYVVPKSTDLSKLAAKIEQFGSGPLKHGNPENPWVAGTQEFAQADPKERLSLDLQSNYARIVKQTHVLCEIEFRSLETGSRKQRAELDGWRIELNRLFGSVHGNIFECDYALPTCRVAIRCSGAMFKKLVEEPIWIYRIRAIESRPNFQTFFEVKDSFKFEKLQPISPPSADAPIVCVIDTGVTSGNPFLEIVTRPDLAKSFLKESPDNPNDEFGHGSSVASLVSYYQLNLAEQGVNQPKVWIANARILNEHNKLEDTRLFAPLLEDVVKYFVPKGVKIFCLCIADSNRIWGRKSKRPLPRKSWVSRRIDQLSRTYDVVFVTCTGNLSGAEFNEQFESGHPYPGNLTLDQCKILDPGQAALALTVGSIAGSSMLAVPREDVAIALRNQPSPFTRSGPGIVREIKPELVEVGGNWMMNATGGSVRESLGLCVPCASNQRTPAVTYKSGTSFAAPRVAHQLALVAHDLQSLGIQKPSASLLKAFLVNSSFVFEERDEVTSLVEDGLLTSDERLMLLGHGRADASRATGCDDYDVVSYMDGTISPDEVQFFDIVVPQELVSAQGEKRLTVTVAFAPEVQKWGLERYLSSEIKWKIFRGDISRDAVMDAFAAPENESDLEVVEAEQLDQEEESRLGELKFVPGYMKRSRGTVQHASLRWSLHKEEYSAGHYTLAVVAYKRWQRAVQEIPLAIVVRLEDLGRSVEIYTRVRTQIEIKAPAS